MAGITSHVLPLLLFLLQDKELKSDPVKLTGVPHPEAHHFILSGPWLLQLFLYLKPQGNHSGSCLAQVPQCVRSIPRHLRDDMISCHVCGYCSTRQGTDHSWDTSSLSPRVPVLPAPPAKSLGTALPWAGWLFHFCGHFILEHSVTL